MSRCHRFQHGDSCLRGFTMRWECMNIRLTSLEYLNLLLMKNIYSSCQAVGTTWFFSSCGGILEVRRGSQPSPGVGPGKPNLPLGLRGKAGGCARVTAGPKRPHLGVCPGPNIPPRGRQGSRGCIPGSPGESGLVSRGSQLSHTKQASVQWGVLVEEMRRALL